jgi:hypothetical protein
MKTLQKSIISMFIILLMLPASNVYAYSYDEFHTTLLNMIAMPKIANICGHKGRFSIYLRVIDSSVLMKDKEVKDAAITVYNTYQKDGNIVTESVTEKCDTLMKIVGTRIEDKSQAEIIDTYFPEFSKKT